MKSKVISLVLFTVFCFGSVSALDFDALVDIPLVDAADYQPQEATVLECADYILTQPIEYVDGIRSKKALAFILRWMEGTPDFMFKIDADIAKPCKGESRLFLVMMACLTKYAVENREAAKDDNKVKLNAFKTFISYCEDPAHNVVLTKDIKKLIKAKDSNKLEKYLAIN